MSTFRKVQLQIGDTLVEADAPYIVSASRATDIPAFFSEWFMARLREGYCVRKTRQNKGWSYTSFENCKVFVFWTKNPIPLLPFLDEIIQRGFKFYFQYTVNDYADYEPNLPPLSERIDAFEAIAQKYGRHTVIWRYDPVFISNRLTIPGLITKINAIGSRLSEFTNKLVFSFVDLEKYYFIKIRLSKNGLSCNELQKKERLQFVERLKDINTKWPKPLQLATCAEEDDFRACGVQKSRCIDPELIERLIPTEKNFLQSLGIGQSQLTLLPGITRFDEQESFFVKDKSQRHECGCAPSKDIGEYNTCPHSCEYCYANTSKEIALKNWQLHKQNPNSETIKGNDKL